MKKGKNVFSIVEIVIIVLITGVVASLTTGVILFSSYSYVGLGNDSALNEFINVYAKVLDRYYEEVDREAMIDSAIDGMMDYLGDDYTIYMDEDEANSLTTQLSGEYEGIGIEIKADNVINAVFDDTPAMKAGIMAGDLIVEVNGTAVTDSAETLNLIGQNDTVTIKVMRDGGYRSFTVTKAVIDKPIVKGEIMSSGGKNVGYLSVSSFTRNVDAQFKKELEKLERVGFDSLIIDLRYNTGGYLDKAENIASMFLEKGKLIYSLDNKEDKVDTFDTTSEKRSYPVVIIMNAATASASEILAAALKDSYGAVLVGQKSYGKGLVQQTMDLGNGDMVKYTTAEWLRPSGTCIDKVGLIPDYEVLLPELEDGEEFVDLQLNKALEVVSSY